MLLGWSAASSPPPGGDPIRSVRDCSTSISAGRRRTRLVQKPTFWLWRTLRWDLLEGQSLGAWSDHVCSPDTTCPANNLRLYALSTANKEEPCLSFLPLEASFSFRSSVGTAGLPHQAILAVTGEAPWGWDPPADTVGYGGQLSQLLGSWTRPPKPGLSQGFKCPGLRLLKIPSHTVANILKCIRIPV